jgi:hypothetical protein
MLQGLADRVKDEAGFSLRTFALAAAAGLSAATVIGFLIAALFVRVAHRYGPVEACLASAAVFLALTARSRLFTPSSRPGAGAPRPPAAPRRTRRC